MDSLLKRVLSIGMVTALTVFGIYGAVHLGRSLLMPQASAASAAGSLVCPATGCTASSCHATDPSAPGPESSSGAGQDDSGSGGSSGALVCPATGCTATSCHASAGSSGGAADGQTNVPGGDAAGGIDPNLI